LAGKVIARETTRAGLVHILGKAGQTNVQGEEQMKLDVFANKVIIRMNSFTGRLAALASEEKEGLIHIPPGYPTGKYVLVFDPLDGSSNVDINATVGTIFAIYRRRSKEGPGTPEDCLQRGRDIVASGYIIYGSSTMMVYTTGQGVHGFTLDPTLGEFLLSHPNLRIPDKPKYHSTNHAHQKYRSEGTRRFTRWLQGMDAEDEHEPLSERYIGALVADFHRNLLKGGIFYYPADSRYPSGKLRLVYEANPLAFIVEQAGGYASDGHGRILDIKPESLHQRTALFIGNRELVRKAEEFIVAYGD
jgi:fructose-1,6-bisphosphatase I